MRAEAHLHEFAAQVPGKQKTVKCCCGQVSLKTQRRRAAVPFAHEGAQNHRARRLLKLARQAEDLFRQLHSHGHEADGPCVAPWNVGAHVGEMRLSVAALLHDARWEILPSLEQVSRQAADLRA